VITFRVVVLDKLADGVAQMTLAQRNDVPQTLVPDRASKPFRVRVQIRAAPWQPQERHHRHLEQALHVRRVERISVHDQVTEPCRGPATASVRLRAICAIQVPSAWAVTPVM
jgi:hypothetical protein